MALPPPEPAPAQEVFMAPPPPEPAPAQEVFMAPAPKTKESPQPDHPGVRTRGGGRHLCCKCVCKSEIFSQNQNSK